MSKFIVAAAIAFAIGTLVYRFIKQSSLKTNRSTGGSSNPDDDGPPISIVALLTEASFIDLNVLQRCMETEFNVNFDSAESDPDNADPDSADSVNGDLDTSEGQGSELRFADPDNFVMETPMGTFMVRLGGHMHGVMAHSEPYFEDVDAAVESVDDLRSKQALAAHKCWIAVDHIGDPPATEDLKETYARLGQLLLAFIDTGLCVAVLLPRAQRFYPWRDDMVDALTSGDVLEDLAETAHVPVTGIDGDDPELQAAVATAHDRWPDFLDAFQNQRGEGFGVKFQLIGDDEESVEFPWMEVTKIHNEIIQGTLANEPIGRDDLHEGSLVTTRLAELNDWLYLDENGERQGGFTVEVIIRRSQESGDN